MITQRLRELKIILAFLRRRTIYGPIMLDFIRNNAANWTVRLLLGAIALSFALFFGYNFSDTPTMGGNIAAMVGDEPIPYRQFQASYNQAQKNFQESFGGEVPENFLEFLRSNTLEQLIQGQVRKQYAESLGLRVSDLEIARQIRQQENFYRDGVFDADYYRTSFRPAYRQQLGLDYEEALRIDSYNQMLASLSDKLLLETEPLEQEWLDQVEQTQWKYSILKVVETDLEKELIDQDPSLKTPEDADEAKKQSVKAALDAAKQDAIAKLYTQWQQDKLGKKTRDTYKLADPKDVTVNLKQRRQIIGSAASETQLTQLLQLTTEEPVPAEPLKLGNTWNFVRFNGKDIKQSTDEQPKQPQQDISGGRLLQAWIDDFSSQLNITKNL